MESAGIYIIAVKEKNHSIIMISKKYLYLNLLNHSFFGD